MIREAFMWIPFVRRAHEREETMKKRMNGALSRIKSATSDISNGAKGSTLQTLALDIERTAEEGAAAMEGGHK